MAKKEEKKGKKDPFEEIVEIINSYEEGCKPRDLTDYEM